MTAISRGGIGLFLVAALLGSACGKSGADGGTLEPPGNSGIGTAGNPTNPVNGGGQDSGVPGGGSYTIPTAPQDLYGYSPGSGEVALTWQPPADAGTGVVTYEIDMSSSSGTSTYSVGGTFLGTTVSSLSPADFYYFVVYAANPGGRSPASSPVSVEPAS